MKLLFPKITWPAWTRNSAGDNFYDITSVQEWSGQLTNIKIAQSHPILTPAILFVAKLFSQAEFFIADENGNRKNRRNVLIDLLNDPNPYQTRQDFLETLMFTMIAQGVAVVAKEKVLGFKDPKALYVLNKDLITWPDGLDAKKWKKLSKQELSGITITYDKDGENIKYRVEDLMFFYDLPNGMQQNPFEARSRLDGLKQTLINTADSLIAKNIILKSNGKEMISAKKDGFPLSPDEKKSVESLFNNKIGLSHSRKRGVVTKADLNWKSLHIALRDLGLDESTKVDGNIVYTALHIPKDILSLEAKKTTYNNFKESMVSYVQNEMVSSLNSAIAVFNKHFPQANGLNGSYDHLPIMQFILLEKYDAITKRANALRSLLSVGIPQEEALRLCGFDESMELNEMMPQTQSNQESSNGESEEETKIRRIG